MVQSVPIVLDNESISNILGSISLYCWIVVFLPQIYENYSRSSSEGLSIEFIIIWLIGDIFNVLGSVLQKLIFTAILLAVYYTIADIILLIQCLKYGNNSMDIYKSSPATPFNEKMKILMARIFGGSYEPIVNSEIRPSLRNNTKDQIKTENTIIKRIKEIRVDGEVISIGSLSWNIH